MVKKKTVDVDQLLSQGLTIFQEEITKLSKGETDKLLDQKSAQILNEYIRTLLVIKREERQANMEEDIDKLDDASLHALAKEAAKLLTKEPYHPAGKKP